MDSARLLRIVVVATAVLLHIVAHLSPAEPHVREPLPEDRPALLSNSRLLPDADDPLAAAVAVAVTDPSVAWEHGGEVVGRSRFRPVSVTLFAAERAIGKSGTGVLAGLVSLLLHVLTALGAASLARSVSGSLRAGWVAGLLTAAAPVALTAAAWPARQPLALAAALGVLGVRLALGGGAVRRLSAGLVLALAGLSHELGYGAAAAAAVLVLNGHGAEQADAPISARLRSVASFAVPVLAAVAWRWSVLSGAAIDQEALRPDGFDAAAGALLTLIAPLLPTRVHVAGGPWLAGTAARITSVLVLALAAYALHKGRRRPAPALLLAALVAALPVLFVAGSGGAPFHDGYSYVILPVLAAGVGCGLAAAATRGPALRYGATAAAALLLGASVATTLSAAPKFRSSEAFVELAVRADPTSPVVGAWALGGRLAAAPDAPSTGAAADADAGGDATAWRARGAALIGLLPQALDLADDILMPATAERSDVEASDAGRRLRRDGAAAYTVASVLSGYATALASLPSSALGEEAAGLLPELERVAEAAVALTPDWAPAWVVLAQSRSRVGASAAALRAAERAARLEPDNLEKVELVARLALRIGRTAQAVAEMERAAALEAVAAERAARPLRREHVLLRAQALSADASTSGILVQFDWAARMLQPLWDEGDQSREMRTALYSLYLRWGDALTSLDKSAMGRLAYQRAVALGGTGSEAADHLAWLESRLRREFAVANEKLRLAQSGEGNVANALLEVAIVLCRSAEWEQADAVFERIAEGQGGMNAPLRFARAIHRHAARDDELELAESELRLVLEEDPEFVTARYELAGVLLQQGRLRDAETEYERAAIDGAAHEWSIEALTRARRLEDLRRRGMN